MSQHHQGEPSRFRQRLARLEREVHALRRRELPDLEARVRALELDGELNRDRWVSWLPVLMELAEAGHARVSDTVAGILHTVVIVVLIAAAVTLTLTGNDAAPAWAALVAYGVGAGAQKLTAKTAKP